MPKEIRKQKSGKYRIYSSIVEGYVSYNLTREEVISYFVQKAMVKAKKETEEILNQLDST